VATTVAPAEWPVALLPIGLETRFVGDELHIRIIPDEIHVEEHEAGLTDREVEAGRAFWRQVWRGGTIEPAAEASERQAWTQLVAAVGDTLRASWIASKTEPGGTRPEQPLAPDEDLPDMTFEETTLREAVWTTAAVARALPDQFVAFAYQRVGSGGTPGWEQIATRAGNPVPDTVQLGLDPTAPVPEVTAEGLVLPDEMQWMIDPGVAEAAGLLIKLPLPSGTDRIERLVVVGVLSGADPESSAERLADLLVGHHYTRGLELLQIGTPTNNTAAGRSGFSSMRRDPDSFVVERNSPEPADGSDGALLTQALGIKRDVMRGVARANDAEQAATRQMNALVWPTTFGYWLESLVQPGVDDALIADIRRHAIDLVRSRGPFPPFASVASRTECCRR
jgi:hypothetical protein